jgi:hypothetical protein
MIEESGFVPRTNGSGGRPKNIRIRIRNTYLNTGTQSNRLNPFLKHGPLWYTIFLAFYEVALKTLGYSSMGVNCHLKQVKMGKKLHVLK